MASAKLHRSGSDAAGIALLGAALFLGLAAGRAHGGLVAPASPEPAQPPAAGDVNFDGRLDDEDVRAMVRALASREELPSASIYDLNGDGAVDQDDLVWLLEEISGVRKAREVAQGPLDGALAGLFLESRVSRLDSTGARGVLASAGE